jgi:hypothetical protein
MLFTSVLRILDEQVRAVGSAPEPKPESGSEFARVLAEVRDTVPADGLPGDRAPPPEPEPPAGGSLALARRAFADALRSQDPPRSADRLQVDIFE